MPRIDEIVMSTAVAADAVPKRFLVDYIKCPVCKEKNKKVRKTCSKCKCDFSKFINFKE